MSIDFDLVEQLLSIVNGTRPTEWPKLKPIHDEAMRELEEIATKEAERATEAAKKAKAELAAKVAAQAALEHKMAEEARVEEERKKKLESQAYRDHLNRPEPPRYPNPTTGGGPGPEPRAYPYQPPTSPIERKV